MAALNAESDSARNRRGVGGKSKAVSAVAEVDSQRLPRPKRPLVLVHIPKTAGTSLTVVLLRNETRDAVKLGNVFKGGGGVELHPDYARKAAAVAQVGSVGLVSGHFPLGVADHLPGKWRPRYITFLRDPVERALSHYFHILEVGRRKERRRQEAAADEPETADTLAEVGWEPTIVQEEPDAPDSDPEVEPLRADMPYDQVLSDLNYVPDNLHTRMLSGDPAPFGEVTPEMLERAKQNLENRLLTFGLVERFDESVVLLKHRLGYSGVLYPVQRSNTQRPRGDEVPADLLEAARGANRMDMELYEFAKELFERAPEHDDLEFQIDVAALRQAKAEDRGEQLEQAPVPAYEGDATGWNLQLSERVKALRLQTQLLVAQRKLRNAQATARANTTQLAEAREAGSRMRVRVQELTVKLEGRRPGNTIDLLRAQETLLRDQIAARTLTLERLQDGSQEFDDAPDEDVLAELRANAESVKEQRADLVKRHGELLNRLREMGVDPQTDDGESTVEAKRARDTSPEDARRKGPTAAQTAGGDAPRRNAKARRQQPRGKQPGAKQSAAKQSGGKQSAAKQSAGKQSASKQSAAKQSGAKQSGAKQSGAKQSAPKQPGAKQSAGKQSAAKGAKQSAARKSGAKRPRAAKKRRAEGANPD